MSMRAACRVACEVVTVARPPGELSQNRIPSRVGVEGSSEAAAESIKIDASDRCGGPLLPSAVEGVCRLLREAAFFCAPIRVPDL